MYIQKIIRDNIQTALKEIFQFETNNIELQQTKKEFEGDVTLVVFPLIKELKLSPKEIAEKIGDYLVENSFVVSYNVVSGFLNLSIADEHYLSFFNSDKHFSFASFGIFASDIAFDKVVNSSLPSSISPNSF